MHNNYILNVVQLMVCLVRNVLQNQQQLDIV